MIRQGPLRLKAMVWFGDVTAFGPGKADLLETIAQEESISAAGRKLGMSYRRCWMLVDTMNRCWREPVVATFSGGGKQRGARLTPLGEEVLAAYRRLERDLAVSAEGEPMATLASLLKAAPDDKLTGGDEQATPGLG